MESSAIQAQQLCCNSRSFGFFQLNRAFRCLQGRLEKTKVAPFFPRPEASTENFGIEAEAGKNKMVHHGDEDGERDKNASVRVHPYTRVHACTV